MTQRGYPVCEVAERLGVSSHSLYKWIRAARPRTAEADELAATKLENQKLKAELRRIAEERDILKKAAARSMGQGNARMQNFLRSSIS